MKDSFNKSKKYIVLQGRQRFLQDKLQENLFFSTRVIINLSLHLQTPFNLLSRPGIYFLDTLCVSRILINSFAVRLESLFQGSPQFLFDLWVPHKLTQRHSVRDFGVHRNSLFCLRGWFKRTHI